jgi:hypothetical protein
MTTVPNYSKEQLISIIEGAKEAARVAATKFFQERLGGVDQYACGVAWVNIYRVKGNTKLGKALKAAGVRQSYTKAFNIWNPSGLFVQNVDTLEAGARAAAEFLQAHGFEAYAGSRLD